MRFFLSLRSRFARSQRRSDGWTTFGRVYGGKWSGFRVEIVDHIDWGGRETRIAENGRDSDVW